MIAKLFAFLLALAPPPQTLTASEEFCLASTIYGEARGESEIGQALVAQTILNRVTDERWPSSICGVVSQRKQFDGYRRAYPKTPEQYASWRTAQQIANAVVLGRFRVGSCATATHFHAGYVSPRWASRMTKLCRVDGHYFYKD